MSRPADPATRATRDAANAAALSVVLFAVLWFLTTQVRAVRELSPFAEDPFDAVATYAAIALPIVAGATWIRSLRHRGPVLPAPTAARIRWGSAVSALIVLGASLADLVAIVAAGWPAEAGASAVGVTGVVLLVAIAAAAAIALLARARGTAAGPEADPREPDVVDDGLALAIDLAGIVHLGRPVEHVADVVEAFLDRSPASPRRHPIGFGFLLATACGLGLTLWHVVREGPPPTLVGPLVFTTLGAAGVLVAYLVTLRPLRLLRPPR